jgi:AcrR family transcriptional regulator
MMNMTEKNDTAAASVPGQSGEMTTKERIFEAALDLAAQKGFDAVSVREIAETVGIKKASLYSHFSSKDELLEQIFEYPMTALMNMAPQGMESEQMIVSMGVNGYMKMASGVFNQWITSPKMEKVWRVICIELYHDKRIKKFFEKFTGDTIDFWRSNFSIMMKHKLIKQTDPDALAHLFLSFYMYAFMDYFIVHYGTSGSFLEAEGKRLDDNMALLVKSIKA